MVNKKLELEESLKKVISSNKVRINAKEKKIKLSKNNFFKNKLYKIFIKCFNHYLTLIIKKL